MPAEHYYNVNNSMTKPPLSYSDHLVNNNDVYPSSKLLSSVKEQELHFERLTRELEAERASVAHRVNQCRIGSDTESMNSISSTEDTFQWGGPQTQDDSLRFGDESHGLMDSCLQELENRGTMNFGEDNMNYMPEDSYHALGQSPYTDQNPYSGMNGGPGSVHSSRVSLHSNSSNRPRQMKMNSRENLGSKSSLPHDHTDNYAPYTSLQRNYDDRGSPLPNGSPRGLPGTPTRFNQYYDDLGGSYRKPHPAYEPHTPSDYGGHAHTPSDYGGHDSFENPMQLQQPDSPFRGPPDRYGGSQSFEDDRYRSNPQVEDSFYRQSPMLDERQYHDREPPPQDNSMDHPSPGYRGDREPLPQDNYMEHPSPGYRGDEDSFRGQGHPDDSYHDGGQPVNRYGQPLNESYGGMPDQGPPVNQYGEPLNDSYRGPGDDSFRGQPPLDERYRDYNDDGYRGHPNDRYPDDQPPNDSFQDPRNTSFQGQPREYPDDEYLRQQEPDRRHEGLPMVQDDPFADDPFRQKQRSLQQLQTEDPYPRGPSPGAGSDRMGPGSYPGERLPPYDQMDSRPPYEDEGRQGYGDEGPRSYMEDGLMPTDARHLQAPPDHYPGNGRLSPDDGSMRWRPPDLQEVIDYLSHPSEAIKGNAAAYLTHLSYMDDDMKQKIRGLDAIPLLVDLLNSDYPEVHKNACGALKNLSYGRSNDENKRAIRNAGGIPSLVRLLRKTQDEDVKDYVTGVLWNLSSCDDLKKPIIDDGLAVLVNTVIIPHSGWEKRGLNPYQATEPWTTVFRNATGILRNCSSAGTEARKKLRECHGLVESLLYSLRTAIDQNNVDNKPVENCVCTLRNLAFRIQEVEDPDFYKKRTATLQRQKKEEKGEKPGCFGGGGKKKGQKGNKPGQTSDQMQQPRLPPGANEYKGLWGVDAVRYYLFLLSGSNPVTLEAACGAIQNLAACDWKFAVDTRALVRKEKGLPSLVDLLTYEVERVVGAAATALRNLSIDDRNKELVGKYATKQLISNLPQENRPKDVTDETLCAVLACLNEVLSHNQDYARQFLVEEGLPRLLYMTRQQHKYKPRTVKYCAAVLKMLWKFKVLHNEYQARGYTEKDFNPPVLSAGGGSSNPNSNFSTPYNTMSRPKDGQGYDDTTLRSRGGYPPNSHIAEKDPRMYQGHSNPAMAHEQPDQYTHGSRNRVDEIPMHDIAPGYAPIDQRNQRNKPPPGGVAIFPHDHQSPGQGHEPLYAQVNKKRRDEMGGEPPSPNHMMLDRGGGGQEGADSWV